MPIRSASTPRLLAALLTLGSLPALAQVFTVSTEQVDGRFLKFEPTSVQLPSMHAGPFTLENLERSLGSEHGYAMRPLPLASRGLTLVANGRLTPAGTDYVTELNSKGISSHAGERVTITRMTFHRDRIVFELNGGPDVPHKYLRHISVGGGVAMMPLAADHGEQATGSRLTLLFPDGVPNVTGDEVKALLAPVVGFGEKSPAESYASTLPPLLSNAVREHRVLVGMNEDMVLHTLGSPVHRVREMNGDVLFEEWIYGVPPQRSEFIRFQGDRVTRVEEASVGASPIVRTANEVGDYWETAEAQQSHERLIKLGDRTQADRDAQNAPQAPPTLRKAGEALPSDKNTNQPSMKPVQFPTGSQSSTPAS